MIGTIDDGDDDVDAGLEWGNLRGGELECLKTDFKENNFNLASGVS